MASRPPASRMRCARCCQTRSFPDLLELCECFLKNAAEVARRQALQPAGGNDIAQARAYRLPGGAARHRTVLADDGAPAAPDADDLLVRQFAIRARHRVPVHAQV